MALPRQMKEIEFLAGLNTKGDARGKPEQQLDMAVNVEFDDIGGLRCRYPFDAVRTNIVGGGTLTNARKLVAFGDQLLCFTVDTLYSWSAAESGWLAVGTHLATEVAEQPVFQAPGDQIQCDRAELGGVVVYTWMDLSNPGSVYAAATDLATGAVIQGPRRVITITISPRLVALKTKILLFGCDPVGRTLALAIGPTTVVADLATVPTVVINTGVTSVGAIYGSDAPWDVAAVPGADAALLATQTSTGYALVQVTAALALTTSNKARGTGKIAIAVNPTATFAQVIRVAAGPTLVGDLINAATLADVAINQAIGATDGASRIAAAYQSVQQGGHYRCYVFWTATDPLTAPAQMMSAWADDGGALGASTGLTFDVGVESRAFDVNGRVYFWTKFAHSTPPSGTDFENTMFLYRDDGFLCAKALDGIAGRARTFDFVSSLVTTYTPLPGVQAGTGTTGAFCTMCATDRRLVAAFGERAPRDLAVRFDSPNARRCALFGSALYIASGEVLLFDGAQVVEAGWHLYPWSLSAAVHVGGGFTGLPNGVYGYEATLQSMTTQGEIDRSTNGVPFTFTMAGGPEAADVTVRPIYQTHKGEFFSTFPAMQVWRTEINPVAGAPLFLNTNLNPGDLTGNNPYLNNDTTTSATLAYTDNLDDADLATQQSNAQNDGSLENLAPPAATIIRATDTRLFLAGIPDLPNQVWYSKTRTVGQVAAFNDALTLDVPTDGGAITNIDVIDGALIVWCETATYAYGGAGFDNTGGGGNFQLARILSTDLGCIGPEACAFFDDGFFVKTAKGWYVLDRALTYQDVGDGIGVDVDKYNSEPVYATIVLTTRHQIRVLTSARMLVFDTLVKQWAETSVNDGLDLLLWNGAPAYLTATGVRVELATWAGYAGTDYTLTAMDVETAWIKFGALQGRAVVDFVQLLGELRSTCVIRKRLAKDYEAASPGVWNYNTDVTWTPSPGVVGSALQVRQSPRWKRCESIKARFTVTAPDGVSPLGGPAVRLTSIAISFALEPNAYGALGAAQKQ